MKDPILRIAGGLISVLCLLSGGFFTLVLATSGEVRLSNSYDRGLTASTLLVDAFSVGLCIAVFRGNRTAGRVLLTVSVLVWILAAWLWNDPQAQRIIH